MRTPLRRFSAHPPVRSLAAKTCVVLAIVAAVIGTGQATGVRELDPRRACAAGRDWEATGPSEVRVLAGYAGVADYFSEATIRDLLLARVLATAAAAGIDRPLFVSSLREVQSDSSSSWSTAKAYFDYVSTQLEGSSPSHRPWASCVSWRSDVQKLTLCRAGEVTGVAEAFYLAADEIEPNTTSTTLELTLVRSSGTSFVVETEQLVTFSSPHPDFDVEEITAQALATLEIVDQVKSEVQIEYGPGEVIRCQLMEATVRAVERD